MGPERRYEHKENKIKTQIPLATARGPFFTAT
jgi:hypothetical protein